MFLRVASHFFLATGTDASQRRGALSINLGLQALDSWCEHQGADLGGHSFF